LLKPSNGNFSQPNPAIVLGTNETGPAAIASSVFRLIDQTTNLTQPADLVIANSTSNTVTVLLGNGDGTFAEAPGSPFAVGLQPRAVVIADFDNDGSLDFAVADSNDNTIATFQGHGDGTFHAISEVTVCAAGDAAGACGDGERKLPKTEHERTGLGSHW